MKYNFKDLFASDELLQAEFGLEKECLRISADGFISKTEHPFGNHQNLQKDFCESQTEFVTDVFESVEEVCQHLSSLHQLAFKTLNDLPNGRELLWPFSNPPYVKDDSDIPVAVFDGAMRNKSLYREYLAAKYGKMKMLYSGIHFNFSFSKKFLKKLYELNSQQSYSDFKNNIYLELSKKLTYYAWLIVYLTAASPVMDGSFLKAGAVGKTVLSGYCSARCSEIGYWNDFTPIISYDSLEAYVASINAYVSSNKLRSASELYYPVRLKPRGENTLENLLQNGVNHIELRMFDDNPLSSIGIFEYDIKFIHLLILYLTANDDLAFGVEEQTSALTNEKAAAKFDDNTLISFNGKTASVREQALDVINAMEKFFKDYGFASDIISRQKKKILQPETRYANIIAKEFGENYVEKGIKLAEKYADDFINGE